MIYTSESLTCGVLLATFRMDLAQCYALIINYIKFHKQPQVIAYTGVRHCSQNPARNLEWEYTALYNSIARLC